MRHDNPGVRLPRTAAAAISLAVALLAGAAAAAGLRLPETVDPGEAVTVAIEPPAGQGSRLLIQPIEGPAGGERAAGTAVEAAAPAVGAGEARIVAPVRPGSYWLILEANGRPVARAFLEVAALPVALRVASPVIPGSEFPVQMSRGGRAGDRIEIVDGAGRVLGSAVLDDAAAASGGATLRAPDASGVYTIVVRDARTGTRLAAQEVTVAPGQAWIRTPFEVAPGARFTVERHGPGGATIALAIVDGAGTTLVEQSLAGSEGATGTETLVAPRNPGRFRLRYLNLASGEVISDLPLLVR